MTGDVRASAAVRALLDELRWLAGVLGAAVAGERPTSDLAAPVETWRAQRSDLVLYVPPELFWQLGDALRAGERWAQLLDEGDGDLSSEETEAAGRALAAVEEQQIVLESLRKWLWSEHEVFILITLGRAMKNCVRRRLCKRPTGWQPPQKGAPAEPSSPGAPG